MAKSFADNFLCFLTALSIQLTTGASIGSEGFVLFPLITGLSVCESDSGRKIHLFRLYFCCFTHKHMTACIIGIVYSVVARLLFRKWSVIEQNYV